MKSEWTYLIGFVVISAALTAYFWRHTPAWSAWTEGMETGVLSSSSSPSSSSVAVGGGLSAGMGEGSSAYKARVQSAVIRMRDKLLLEKYRSNYEETVVQLDELFDQLILQEALGMNLATPNTARIAAMAQLHQAKLALNSALKYIDG